MGQRAGRNGEKTVRGMKCVSRKDGAIREKQRMSKIRWYSGRIARGLLLGDTSKKMDGNEY